MFSKNNAPKLNRSRQLYLGNHLPLQLSGHCFLLAPRTLTSLKISNIEYCCLFADLVSQYILFCYVWLLAVNTAL